VDQDDQPDRVWLDAFKVPHHGRNKILTPQLMDCINKESNKARMVAGYCWDWKGKKNPDIEDVTIPEHASSMRWNLDTDSSLWNIAPDSVSEIGCIHTRHVAGCDPRRPSGPNPAILTSMDTPTTLLTEISEVTARERRLISCYHAKATTMQPEPDKLVALIDTVRAVDAAGVPYAAVWRWAFSRPFSAPPSMVAEYTSAVNGAATGAKIRPEERCTWG